MWSRSAVGPVAPLLTELTIALLIVDCVQAVQLILDQCRGVVVNEPEGVKGDAEGEDESGCRAAGETPGNLR